MPFSLYVSKERRKQIMASMMPMENRSKADGEKILHNYKRQLAEKVAREKIVQGQVQAKKPNQSTTSS